MQTHYSEQFYTISNILNDLTEDKNQLPEEFTELSCAFADALNRHEIHPVFVISYLLYRHLKAHEGHPAPEDIFADLNEEITLVE